MRSQDRSLEVAALLVILALAAYVRLANLTDNPGWYTDEGTHLDIARHLLAGRVQYLAVDQSLLLFSRLPLFEGLFAVWARLFGVSMAALRTLTGALGVLTVAWLYGVTRRLTHDRLLALLAAFCFAIYPPAVLYSRFGFSYNLLAPLLLIALCGAHEYVTLKSARWLAVSAGAIGLAAISEVWGWGLIVPLAAVVALRNWRDLLWSLPLALLPFGVYAAIMLGTVPHAFTFDLAFVLSRVNQLSISQQAATLIQNITTLSAQDSWLWIGTVGWLMLRPTRTRLIVLAFAALPFALLGRTTALFSLSYYYMIPLLPLTALGVASAIRFGVAVVRPHWRGVLAVGLGGLIGLLTIPPLLHQVNTQFRSDIEPFLIDAPVARQAAAFVNAQVSATDRVIASPAVAWQIQAAVADFQMPVAFGGQATPHLPATVPADRWVFEPRYQTARFVIVDNLWRNWAVPNVPGVRDMLREVETWPRVFEAGNVTVYQQPR